MNPLVAFNYPRAGFAEKPLLFRGWVDVANKVALAITILLLASWALPNIPALIPAGSGAYYALYSLAGVNVLALVISVVHRIHIKQYFSKNNIEFEPYKGTLRNFDDENIDCVSRAELPSNEILILSDSYFYHIGAFKAAASTEHKTLVQNFHNGTWISPYCKNPLTIFDKVKYLQKRAELFSEDHDGFIGFCARRLEELVSLADKLCAEETLTAKNEACATFRSTASEEFLSRCLISTYKEKFLDRLTLSHLLSEFKDESSVEVAGIYIWNSLRQEGCVKATDVPYSIAIMAEVHQISLN